MMKLVAYLLIFIFVAPTFAVTKRSICESEAKRDHSAAAFLRLIRSGLNLNVIHDADLEWGAASEAPVNLVRAGRSLNSLSLKRAIDELLPTISKLEWNNLRPQIRAINDSRALEKAQIEKAKDLTAPLYKWHTLSYRPQGIVTSQYVAKNGDVFVATQDGAKIILNEIHQLAHHTLEFKSIDPGYQDFYETQNGQVAFTTLSENGVQVVDARTGKNLLNFDVSVDQFTQRYNVAAYRSLLFEEDGQLKVLVLPKVEQIDNSIGVPLLIVTVQTGEFEVRKLPTWTAAHVKRLENGKIYCYGVGVDNRTSQNLVYIFDVAANRYNLRGLQKVVHAVPSKTGMAGMPTLDLSRAIPNLYLDPDGNPQIIFGDNSTQKFYRFDKQQKIAIEIMSFPRLAQSPTLFRDSDGQMKIVYSIKESNGDSTENIVISPLDGTPPTTYQIELSSPIAHLLNNAVISTPSGIVILHSEIVQVASKYIKLLELSTGHVHSISSTSGNLEPTFYSPRDHTILGFGNAAGRAMDEFYLYQLWGAQP